MIHLIVASHGHFSQELVKSAEMVYGECSDTHVVTFLPGEGQDDIVEKYNAIISKFPSKDDAVMFVVDLFGGSPYNAAARVVAERPQDNIVTGMSLPMLLEVVDAKDSCKDTVELGAIALEVGQASVRLNKEPAGAAPKAQPVAAAPTVAKEPENYDPNGRMNVNLVRIDDRLIHGQVATSWAKVVKCEAIFAISDEVAKDDLRRELLLQIAPPHLKTYVIPVEKAIKVYNNPKYAGRNVLMLVTKPADALRLIEGGVKIDSINVGGMTYKDGNKLLSDAVTVGKGDVEAFNKLLDMGVDLSMQKVASNPKVELTKAKLDAIQF